MLIKFFINIIALVCVGVAVMVAYLDEEQKKTVQDNLPVFVKDAHASVKSFFNEEQSSADVADRIFTKEELSGFDGSNGKPIYLALMGKVFDVTKGARHYAPENHYGGFAAKDGTRAFVTGEFTKKGLIEDISDFTPMQMHELHEWEEFYKTSYTYVGKVIGHYYDKNGKPTEGRNEFEEKLKEALDIKKNEARHREIFPPCNSEWSPEKGSRVWCTNKSGGVERGWVGVPRKYHKPGESSHRCVCVRTHGKPSDHPDAPSDRGDLDNPHLQQFEQCAPSAESCPIIKV